MHSNWILDSVANLLVRHLVFVGNVQKSPIASHLKGLDPSVSFRVKIQLSQAQRNVDKMSVRISLTLEASEMFLSLHMIFSLERAAVVCAILERISTFYPSLEMIAQRYLKFSTSSSLWPFILISLWKPFGLLSSLLSCLDRSPFCTLWWFYQDGLSGRQPLLPVLHLRQCHLQSGSW